MPDPQLIETYKGYELWHSRAGSAGKTMQSGVDTFEWIDELTRARRHLEVVYWGDPRGDATPPDVEDMATRLRTIVDRNDFNGGKAYYPRYG